MRLTTYTDYALRTLMYLGEQPERLVRMDEIAAAHGIPRNHLTKVVHQLGMGGFIDTIRGRKGGLRLARPAGEIRIGEVVRYTETDFQMAECFGPDSNACRLASACRLKGVLDAATRAYLSVLDQTSLADLVSNGMPAGANIVAPARWER